jgi:hypothetical protein
MAGANDYDVAAALAEFHESRGGVRGLVESGITAVPRLFLAPAAPATPQPQPAAAADFALPTVDLSLPRSDAIKLVQAAARSCGFFHVINHGVPAGTIDAAVSAARAFHEQPLGALGVLLARASRLRHLLHHPAPVEQASSGRASPPMARLAPRPLRPAGARPQPPPGGVP